MRISLQNVSKRYDLTYILKGVNGEFQGPGCYGIQGRNGSGKSTLLKAISGVIDFSEGSIAFYEGNAQLAQKVWRDELIFSAPYILLTQDFTLRELLTFYKEFREFSIPLSYEAFLDVLEWKDPKQKMIKHFSSGMQQRVNLALSILTKSRILLLDEPSSYLDTHAKEWFHRLLVKEADQKLIIIASNDEGDFQEVQQRFQIESGRMYPVT